MLNKKKRLTKLDFISFIIFLLVYETSGTIYELPGGGALRWVVCFLLVGISSLHSFRIAKGKMALLPKSYGWLLFPLLIQSFWNLTQTPVALARSFSFLIYTLALSSLFTREYTTASYVKEVYKFFAKTMVFFVLPLNVLNWNRASAFGDYMGIYDNRNFTVSIMLSIFVLTIILFLCDKSRHGQIGMVLLVIETLLLFRTHSRMSIIGFAVILMVTPFFLQKGKDYRKTFFIVLAALAAIAVLIGIGISLKIPAVIRILSPERADGATGLFRGPVWEIAIDLITQRPIVGWGNNSVYYNTFVAPPASGGWGVHNSYFVMLIEGGIIGLFCYIGFFSSMAIKNIKRYRDCRKLGMERSDILFVRFGVLLCMVSAINGMSESFLFSAGNTMSLPFWFTLLAIDSFLCLKSKELKLEENNGT